MGVLLAEAVTALAVVGLAAVAAGTLAAAAFRVGRSASEIGAARRAAASALARVAAVSRARLPGVLGGDGDDRRLVVRSVDTPDHELVAGLATGLPGGRLEIVAEGLAPGGGPAPFLDSVAVRVRARVAWRRADGAGGRVELVDVRP